MTDTVSAEARGRRKVRQDYVLSDKMDKALVVEHLGCHGYWQWCLKTKFARNIANLVQNPVGFLGHVEGMGVDCGSRPLDDMGAR